VSESQAQSRGALDARADIRRSSPRWSRRRRRDLAESQHVFNNVIEEWALAQPGNQELLALAREEVANYRKGE